MPKEKNKISDWMCPWTRSKYIYFDCMTFLPVLPDDSAVQSNGAKKNHFCCCGWSGRIQFRNSECLGCRVYDNFAPAARVSKLKLKEFHVWCKWRILRAKFRYVLCHFRLTFHHEMLECGFLFTNCPNWYSVLNLTAVSCFIIAITSWF